MNSAEQARALLREEGSLEAWQRATRKAIDAQLKNNSSQLNFWQDVQAELMRIAPRSGPGDLDIYRSAKLLIAEHGSRKAMHVAWQRGGELEGDLMGQTAWARILNAIAVLSESEPDPTNPTR